MPVTSICQSTEKIKVIKLNKYASYKVFLGGIRQVISAKERK
jgi:hypothetical protein